MGDVAGARDGCPAAARVASIRGMAFGASSSTLYMVVPGSAHVVRAMDASTGYVRTVAGTLGIGATSGVDGYGAGARFNGPVDCALSCDESILYIAEETGHVIRALDLNTGYVTTLSGAIGAGAGAVDGAAAAARFDTPQGLVTSCDAVYVMDKSNDVIRQIDPATGAVSTLAGSLGAGPGSVDGSAGTARFRGPSQGVLSVDATTLYVTDQFNHAIRAIDLATGDVSTVAGQLYVAGAADGDAATALFDSPYGIAVRGGTLYVAEVSGYAIRAVDIASGRVTTLAGALGVAGAVDGPPRAARLDSLRALALRDGPVPVLYVADQGNNVVREVALPAETKPWPNIPGEVTAVYVPGASAAVIGSWLPRVHSLPED